MTPASRRSGIVFVGPVRSSWEIRVFHPVGGDSRRKRTGRGPDVEAYHHCSRHRRFCSLSIQRSLLLTCFFICTYIYSFPFPLFFFFESFRLCRLDGFVFPREAGVTQETTFPTKESSFFSFRSHAISSFFCCRRDPWNRISRGPLSALLCVGTCI